MNIGVSLTQSDPTLPAGPDKLKLKQLLDSKIDRYWQYPHSMAFLQIVVFAKSFVIGVHSLAPSIDELMNARNRNKQLCHGSRQGNTC
jgi:hypothetical protein